jgi:hypothetical protein
MSWGRRRTGCGPSASILCPIRSVQVRPSLPGCNPLPSIKSRQCYATKLAVSTGGGATYPRHLDNTGLPDTRKLTLVYYLNPDWHKDHGGHFRLFGARGTEVRRRRRRRRRRMVMMMMMMMVVVVAVVAVMLGMTTLRHLFRMSSPEATPSWSSGAIRSVLIFLLGTSRYVSDLRVVFPSCVAAAGARGAAHR